MKWLKEIFDKRYVKVSFYVIITAVIIKCLSQVADDATSIFGWLITKIHWVLQVLNPVAIGFVFAYLANPVIKFFEKKIQKVSVLKKQARGISVFITLLLIVAAVASILSVLVFSVTDQLRLANLNDMISALNQVINSLNDFYLSLMEKLKSIDIQSEQITGYLSEVLTYLFEMLKNGLGTMFLSLKNVSGYFTTIAFSIIIGIYFMLDGKMITNYLNRIVRAVCSEKFDLKLHEFLQDLHSCFSGYLQGQMSDVLFMMVAISLTLSIIGVKFSVLIGILAGLGNLIPYCGPFIAYALTGLVCLVNGQYQTLMVSIIALIIIQGIDGNFIGPKLLSRSIEIHPLLVIIFLIFGSAVGGLAGMLLAVPVGGFAKLMFTKWLTYKELQKGIVPVVSEEEEPPIKNKKKRK